jgi:hypothetical protein
VFALCIVRRPSDGKFLMTQEYAGGKIPSRAGCILTLSGRVCWARVWGGGEGG